MSVANEAWGQIMSSALNVCACVTQSFYNANICKLVHRKCQKPMLQWGGQFMFFFCHAADSCCTFKIGLANATARYLQLPVCYQPAPIPLFLFDIK